MSRFRVLITDFPWGDLTIERAILDRVEAELIPAPGTDRASLTQVVQDVDVIMACWTPLPAEVIAAATSCRLIARLGIGLDNIDVDFCSRRGIRVTNVPDYCIDEVAEHTLALLLAVGRRIVAFSRAVDRGIYELGTAGSLHRLRGQQLGIVGLGRIGSRVAQLAEGLGLEVVACTRTPSTTVPCVSLEELLRSSDFVSLHLPLTEATRRLIGASQFAQMKPQAVLINTARGGLVDHAALARALAANQLAGAALDVQDPEPPPLDQPPYNDPRVVITPHAAFVSAEAVSELRRRAAEQVATHLRGGLPENIVNP